MAEMFLIALTVFALITLLVLVLGIIIYGIFDIDLFDIIMSPWTSYKRNKKEWKEEQERIALAKEFEERYGIPYSQRYRPDIYSEWATNWGTFQRYH